MLTKLARVGVTAAALVLAATTFTLAETSATPASKTVLAQATAAPTASPNPFTYHGYVRAYDFYRDNAYHGHNAVNQQSENNAISLSGQYRFEDTGLSIGASYLYANPLNGCTQASQDVYPANNSNTCYQGKALGGATGTPTNAYLMNPDNTLPSFSMSTLYEAYLQYVGHGFYFKGGNQVINTPWAPNSDSRLKPVAFQGADLSYKINKNWIVEGSDYWEWECRTCSDFGQGTLLTALSPVPGNPTGVAYNGYAGASAYPSNYYDPAHVTYNTNGFAYGRLGYVGDKDFPLTANVYYYGFENISNVVWADAKFPFASTGKYKAFVALQGGGESNTGSAYLGKISSTVFGIQGGFNPIPNVTLTGGFDTIPWKTDTVTLPNGFSCVPSGQTNAHTIKSPANYAGNLPYFLPTSGTGNCTSNANGTTNIYYGGWASPYTDSYATDPLFTTGGTQGMIDRRSGGNSFKVAANFTNSTKQLNLIFSQEWYDYNNNAYAQSTNETDADAQYFFSKVPKVGLYKGFSLRVRIFSRSESPAFTGFAGAGLFKYNRFQAEYDF